MDFLFLLVSFGASVVGAICGIGGGIVIKPVLDAFKPESVAAVSFLSSCTVLAMAAFSVAGSVFSRDGRIEKRIARPLAAGAALGGIAGQKLLQAAFAGFPFPDRVGVLQAAGLALITLGTLAYTLNKRSIRTRRVESAVACAAIGALLGSCSSFLGIGGGPVNLVVLYFFFSLDAKGAAQNSLYVIFFSQAANLLSALLAGAVPAFAPAHLLLMLAGGAGGGLVGRLVYRRMDNLMVERLFAALLVAIAGVSLFGAARYSGLF